MIISIISIFALSSRLVASQPPGGGGGGGGGGGPPGFGEEAVIMPVFKHHSEKSSPPHIFHHIWWQGHDDMMSRANIGKGAGRNTPAWRAQFIPKWVNSWSHHNPSWKHQMWDESSILILAAETGHTELIHSMKSIIKKVDVARYLILLKHGGVVLDIDFEAFHSIETLVEGHSAVLVEDGKDQNINSAWMASIPNHPLIQSVLIEIKKRQNGRSAHLGVHYVTGKRMLTDVSHEWERARWEHEEDDGWDVYILHHASEDNLLLYPYHAEHMDRFDREFDEINREEKSSSCSETDTCAHIYPNSMGMHHFAATWYDDYRKDTELEL